LTTDMRERLLRLRRELESAAAASEHSTQVVELDQSRVGRLSRMDAMQAQAMSQAAARQRDSMLRGITTALERIDNDEYGFCQSCEEPINPLRLEINPTAKFCIQCAEKSEL